MSVQSEGKKSETINDVPLYDLYQNLVIQSQGLGLVKIRKSYFVHALSKRLASYGGMTVWLGIHVIAITGILGSTVISFPWAALLGIVCGILLSYVVGIHNFTAFMCDLVVLFKGVSVEDYIYDDLTRVTFNKISLVVVPIIVLILIVIASQFSLFVVYQIFTILIVFASSVFLLNQLSNSWKLLNDFLRLVYSIRGKKSIVFKTKEQLIKSIVQLLRKNDLSEDTYAIFCQLADADVRQAEVRLELMNLALALTAILISVLFSDQILLFFLELIHSTDGVLVNIGNSISFHSLLVEPYRTLLSAEIHIGLWWQIANLIISFIFILLKALLTPYFTFYRPLYSLNQALILVKHEVIKQGENEKNLREGVLVPGWIISIVDLFHLK
jgi:hypothetical protein